MEVLYPSQEWCDEWKRAINANPSIKQLGQKWGVGFNGNLLFEIQAGDGLENTTYVFMQAAAGQCTECTIVQDAVGSDYGFYVTGKYADFKEVVKGNKGFMEGVVKGVFKIKGDTLRLMRNAKFVRAVADSISSVDARYLGE
ncbi:MAG: SCP2 sterol-binding domain-containing protein [Thermodesulfobacteriota bacterium]